MLKLITKQLDCFKEMKNIQGKKILLGGCDNKCDNYKAEAVVLKAFWFEENKLKKNW